MRSPLFGGSVPTSSSSISGSPGRGGVELLKAIRSAAPALRVIMMMNTPLVAAPYEKLCVDAGAAMLVDKTHDFLRLQAILGGLAVE